MLTIRVIGWSKAEFPGKLGEWTPNEQAGTVVSGALELTIDGETRWLAPGDTYLIPGGVEHGAQTGDNPARVLDVFSPVREEYKY
jgi:quercetin dioxygenase-like cupin family protein